MSRFIKIGFSLLVVGFIILWSIYLFGGDNVKGAILGVGRTIVNPVANSSLSSSVIRSELQTLEDEITNRPTDMFPFATNYGTSSSATSTTLWFRLGYFASSTSYFVDMIGTNSTTTNATTTKIFSTTASSTDLFSTSFTLGNGRMVNSTTTQATTTHQAVTNLTDAIIHADASGSLKETSLSGLTYSNGLLTAITSANASSTQYAESATLSTTTGMTAGQSALVVVTFCAQDTVTARLFAKEVGQATSTLSVSIQNTSGGNVPFTLNGTFTAVANANVDFYLGSTINTKIAAGCPSGGTFSIVKF